MKDLDTDKIEEQIEENEFVVIAEFRCFASDKTFISTARLYNDGGGYYDIKSDDECPHCGRDNHWINVSP